MPAVVEHGEVGGVATLTLRNAAVRVTVVPALGARILSLRAVAGTREWLWRPEDGRGLFACAEGKAFEEGSLAGVDECLPTVLPCTVEGQALPDHGELWNREWSYDVTERGAITTRIELQTRPLNFARRLALEGNVLRLDYTLTNRADRPVGYLWALHPLFTLAECDTVELPGAAEVTVQGTQGSAFAPGDRGAWPSPQGKGRLDLIDIAAENSTTRLNSFFKAFMSTAHAPTISLVDQQRGERLTLEVAPREVPVWGYWVSRGGWFGHTHIALEATNAAVDGLDELTPGGQAHTLAPREVRAWTVRITLETGRCPPRA